MGPELHDRLAAAVNTETYRIVQGSEASQRGQAELVVALVPDLTAYCNLWLALTCFAVK
jgi:hypothetical protein